MTIVYDDDAEFAAQLAGDAFALDGPAPAKVGSLPAKAVFHQPRGQVTEAPIPVARLSISTWSASSLQLSSRQHVDRVIAR